MGRKIDRISEENTVVAVGPVMFGSDHFPVIAGPCAVESQAQINAVAEAVSQAGASALRAAVVPTGASAYAFGGRGSEGVAWLVEAGRRSGLPVITQVNEPQHVEDWSHLVDMIEIGSSNMQNFELLRIVGQSKVPVLLKRASSATIDEWLWAAEYVLAEGNDQVVLVERGIRTFGESPTLDLTSVAIVKERSHLPVLALPSHAVASRTLVGKLTLAAHGVGADGVIVEVHPDPDSALANPENQIGFVEFAELMHELGVTRLRTGIDAIDYELVDLLARRQRLALKIGQAKAERGAPVRSPDREAELIERVRTQAAELGYAEDIVEEIYGLILEASRRAQEQLREQT
ncbi:MAG: 3-deoxy-7-phosphoheptulonate synthase [Acidimicrobiia bacterium]|nr:3-deoxy-7-phosphoheptulonate synthase [Acidimicrobiia bacterium]